MNILILGGNGYLGSKIVKELLDRGNFVVCTTRAQSDLSRIAELQDSIKRIPASTEAVETAMQFFKFDYVLNMICNYGQNTCLNNNVLKANLEFPLEILNLSVACGVKNFLTIGTGLPDSFNMYSYAKKQFNEFGKFYADKYGINFQSLLLEMFYGGDEPLNRFLPSVIKKMLMQEDVKTTVGTQHRDIICVQDVLRAILLVMQANLNNYHEIPVGTGVAPTIAEIIDYIWEKTDRKSAVYKGAIPMRKDEPDCVADTSILSSLGKWQPLNWKDGVYKMIMDMKKLLCGGGVKLLINQLVRLHFVGGAV